MAFLLITLLLAEALSTLSLIVPLTSGVIPGVQALILPRLGQGNA